MEVAVFGYPGKKAGVTRCNAYTRIYNPEWKGCCLHQVDAPSGTEAKRLAIAEHRAKCLEKPDART
jgi:hypothetical protein